MEVLVEALDEKKEVRHVTLDAENFDDIKAQLEKKGWQLHKYQLDHAWEEKEIQPLTNALSFIITAFGFLLIAAIVFSYPFPFIRRAWIQERWGYYGLLNAVAYLAIGYGVKKKMLEATFVGFGILIFDQWITWRSFMDIVHHANVNQQYFFFLFVSVFLSGCLATLLGMAAHRIYDYLRIKQKFKPKEAIENFVSYWAPPVLSLILPCLLIRLGIEKGISLSPKLSYSVLRILGLAFSMFILGYAGYCLKGYVKSRNFLWWIFILLAASALVYFDHTLMGLLPFSSVKNLS